MQQQQQPLGSDACAELACTHVCLLHPEGATCHCPSNMTPNSDLCVGTLHSLHFPTLNNSLIFGKHCRHGSVCENGGTCEDVTQFHAVRCSCPVGFAGARCQNQTGVFLAYPLLSGNSYAWVAGVLCVLVLSIVGLIFGIYCCKKKRQQHEVINIIKFRNALLRKGDKHGQEVLIDANSFENPGFAEEEEDVDENSNNPATTIHMSSSVDSIDSAYLSRHDGIMEGDQLSTKQLMMNENDYDSS